jgi:hypothetical protein
MRYILNYDWLGYKKGHVFESKDNLDGFYYNSNLYYKGDWMGVLIIDLLLKSGALSEVKPDCKWVCSICNKENCTEHKDKPDCVWNDGSEVKHKCTGTGGCGLCNPIRGGSPGEAGVYSSEVEEGCTFANNKIELAIPDDGKTYEITMKDTSTLPEPLESVTEGIDALGRWERMPNNKELMDTINAIIKYLQSK